ncbi:fidgetin-like protein 1 [Glandiceps talaboti]
MATEDNSLLNQWQKNYFKLRSDESTASQRADAIRGILSKIQYAQAVKSTSSRLPRDDISVELNRQYMEQYASIVDNADNLTGVNNYAEAALASNKPNESMSWKSSLTSESIMQFSCVKKLIQISKASPSMEADTDGDEIIIERQAVGRPTSLGKQSHEPPNTNIHVPANHTATKPVFRPSKTLQNDGAKFNYTPANSTNPGRPAGFDTMHSHTGPGRPVQESNRPAFVPNQFDKASFNIRSECESDRRQPYTRETTSQGGWSGSYNTSSVNTQQPFKRKASFTNRDPDPGNVNYKSENTSRSVFYGKRNDVSSFDDGYNDDMQHQQQQPQTLFKTAKEQLAINNQKKFSNRRGPPNTASYGGTKKSLGTTRRGINSKFVPPILNRDNEDDGATGGSSTGQRKNDGSEEIVDERLKNIDPKMIELISSEIMDHGPPIAWDDIAGLEFAKTTIKEIVIWPMLRPDIFKGLRGPPKGLLLFGPPGTGKTLIGKCIACQSGATFFSISASSLTSKYVGEGEKMVRALFAVARCHQPAVVFIDEIDSLLTQRVDGEHESSRRIKTEFLVQLDGAGTDSGDRILVVGATNRPQEIDEAARRRLVKRLYIPLPELPARRQIVENLLSQQSYSLSDHEINQMCEKTEGYSGADMANLCREAALGPIRCIQVADIQHISADQVRPILYQDFEEALRNVRPSVSQKDLDVYLEWNQQYGSGVK